MSLIDFLAVDTARSIESAKVVGLLAGCGATGIIYALHYLRGNPFTAMVVGCIYGFFAGCIAGAVYYHGGNPLWILPIAYLVAVIVGILSCMLELE